MPHVHPRGSLMLTILHPAPLRTAKAEIQGGWLRVRGSWIPDICCANSGMTVEGSSIFLPAPLRKQGLEGMGRSPPLSRIPAKAGIYSSE